MSKVEIVESKIPLVLTKAYVASRTSPPQLNVDVFEVIDQVCPISKDIDNATNPTAANTYKFGFIVVDLGEDYQDYDRIVVSNVGFNLTSANTSADVIHSTSNGERWFDNLTTPNDKRMINSMFTTFPTLINPADGSTVPVSHATTQVAAAGVRINVGPSSITFVRLNSDSAASNTRLLQSRYVGFSIGQKSGKNVVGTCYATLLKWK